MEIQICHNLLSGNELVVKALQVVPNEDIARHLKKPRSRYLGRGFALKSFLEVSYILQHLETRVRIYTISIDPDICEL